MWVELSHNTSWNLSTGTTPYEITFGRKPFSFPEYLSGTSNLDVVDEILTNWEEVFNSIRKKLIKAQASMKHHVDAKHREINCQTGDWVRLKLHPYRQKSAKGAQVVSDKLAKRFYSPFQIIDRIDTVAYQLQLPESSQIHPVLHCSMLKSFHGIPDRANIAQLPDHFVNDQPLITPLAISDYRHSSRIKDAPWDVLVQ